MAQFNFTTNIENRMPDTGKVFCIDRMTSDYAQAHPFDVDAFIESVYQEFVGTEFEESREVLHNIWTAVLSVKSQCGDASLYPNKNGARRAAAMKVWMKAGEYWRRGLRTGDTLPDMVPMTRITRLDDGSWIALFPKDAYLIENGKLKIENEEVNCEQPIIIEPLQHQSEPQPTVKSAEQEVIEGTTDCTDFTDNEPLTVNHEPSATLKAIGMVAAATVALFVIYETGLLIPLGLIGLATGGILK